MKVLVTGGAGFVGVNLAQELREHGHEPVCFDNFSTGERVDADRAGYSEIIEGDITNRVQISEATTGVGAIVHLAAQAGVPSSIRDPWFDAEQNVFGTLAALMAAQQSGVPRFVFASSAAPLGGLGYPASEAQLTRPLSPYGASKTSGEAYCSAFNGAYGMTCTALRFTNLYGPYSYHKGSVVAHYMKSISDGQPLQINGDGTQTRDFLFVSDLVKSIRQVIETEKPGQLYQLGSGVETSINGLVSAFEDALDRELERRFADPLPGEVPRSVADISLARSDFGYDPKVALVDGLRMTKQWFDQHVTS